MSDEPRVEWAKGAHFAEAAEALKIRTDQVMAAGLRGGRLFVMWSDGDDDDAPIMGSFLARRKDDLMPVVVVSRPVGQTVGQFKAEIEAQMEGGETA